MRLFKVAVACLLLFCLPVSLAESKAGMEKEDLPPKIMAQSAILIEASTGRMIYEKNADEKRPPASMTKMMTCILGLEKLSPRTPVVINFLAAGTEDSSLGLQPSDIVNAGNLLTGMMMVSDNGAAVALAKKMAGSVPEFAVLMNEKAVELGCKDTHFENPNGLPNENHYSTARDMAKIAAFGMKQKEFREIVSQQSGVMRWDIPNGKFMMLENTNELLKSYDGMNGIKTGWTNAAGGCLAASARRNGVELIAVIMHSETQDSRFEDAGKLLDYGFSHVKMQRGITKERLQKSTYVKNGKDYKLQLSPAEDVNYPLINGEDTKKYGIEYEIPPVIEAPVKKGQVIGKLILKYSGKPIAVIDMKAQNDVEEGFSFLSYFFVGLLSHFM